MRWLHSSCAAVLVFLATPAAAQQPGPANATASLTVFVRGVAIGTEQSTVSYGGDGWTITATGRLGAPLDIVTRRLQVRYDANWKPIELTIDAVVRGQMQTLRTTVEGTTVTNQLTAGTQTNSTTSTTPVDVLLPSPFFAPYEALAARLKTAAAGTTLIGYAPPGVIGTIQVGESETQRIQTPTRTFDARRTHMTTMPPAGSAAPTLEMDVWADENGRLLRVSVPAQALEVAREDIASVSTRRVPISRPNDEAVRIQGNGFSLAGTVSKPTDAGNRPLPAVVFVAGSGAMDRDEFVYGIPVLGELAGAVADAGFLTLRYDKRGVGQSGGRIESAGFVDFVDDLRAAVKYVSERKDVDPKRVAVVGHSEGGLVALLAAAKDKRIAGIGLLGTNGVPGSDLVLEQQTRLLNRSTLSDAEKQAKIDLQKQVNQAVLTGRGWENVPAEARRAADNPEFQSILATDPAKVMPDVRQPILIVQGELDTQVAPSNADRLDMLAKARKNAGPATVVKVPGVNHLLAPATTGEVDEYATLTDKHVSPAVSGAVVKWLQTALTGGR